MNSKINIAIDGYSSCGKGTLARFIADTLGYRFVDSGSMYRAVTYYVLEHRIDPQNREAVIAVLKDIQLEFEYQPASERYEIILNHKNVEREIRTLRVAQHVSNVAKIPEVRSHLVELQKALAKDKGVVMDGRDIATVVLPDAELKIFMTARPEVRAERRFKELILSGVKTTFEAVLQNVNERDHTDSQRDNSPLILTGDYRVLDNSDLTIDEQNKLALIWVEEALADKSRK